MSMKTFTLAAALMFAVSGAALAQTPTGGGKAEGNMNNPGSVKSESEKSMERTESAGTGSMGTGMAPGASGGPSTATTGSAAGSTGGNAVTGSGAAPSGK